MLVLVLILEIGNMVVCCACYVYLYLREKGEGCWAESFWVVGYLSGTCWGGGGGEAL